MSFSGHITAHYASPAGDPLHLWHKQQGNANQFWPLPAACWGQCIPSLVKGVDSDSPCACPLQNQIFDVQADGSNINLITSASGTRR
jgi:hypothetical protein